MSSMQDVDPKDIYPMPMFLTLQVSDLAEAQRYYHEVLGFRTFYTIPAPDGSPAVHHMRRNRYQDILLVKGDKPGVSISFNVEGETEQLAGIAERARQAGEGTVEGPVERPWNTIDVAIDYPGGYQLVFTGWAHEAAPSMGETIAKIHREMKQE